MYMHVHVDAIPCCTLLGSLWLLALPWTVESPSLNDPFHFIYTCTVPAIPDPEHFQLYMGTTLVMLLSRQQCR